MLLGRATAAAAAAAAAARTVVATGVRGKATRAGTDTTLRVTHAPAATAATYADPFGVMRDMFGDLSLATTVPPPARFAEAVDKLLAGTRLSSMVPAASSEAAAQAGTLDALMRLRLDVYETAGEYHVVADVPGIPRNNLRVDVDDAGHTLTLTAEARIEAGIAPPSNSEVRGEVMEQEGAPVRWHRVERSYGAVKRSMALPVDADTTGLTARLVDGVLRISLPKTPTTPPPPPRRRDIVIA